MTPPSPKPDLTVIMPAKGRARFVGEALESVRRQTLRNWRMLIVHGASDDGALEILRTHARADSRIELLPERQSGFAHAINQGVAQTDTPFFVLQESDDISHPERFANLLAGTRAHPQVDVFEAWTCFFDSAHRRPVAPPSILAFPSGCFRTAAFKQFGQLRPFFTSMSDLDMLYRWEDSGAHTVRLPVLLYFKRQHTDPRDHLGRQGQLSLEWVALCLSRWCERHAKDKAEQLVRDFTRARVVRIFRSLPKARQHALLHDMFRYAKKRFTISRLQGYEDRQLSDIFEDMRDTLTLLGISERQTRLLLLRLRIAHRASLQMRKLRTALRRRRNPALNLPQQPIDGWMAQSPITMHQSAITIR